MLTRRRLLQSAVLLAAQARAQGAVKSIDTPALTIAYEESGAPRGFPVILLHGFPDDVRAYDAVIPPLTKAGLRVLVPWLRGYGPTRLHPGTLRMAEQAAIGQDLIDFADALKLPRFAAAGFDWGGRAAGVAAALHPDRFRALVLIGGYTVQNVFTAQQPAAPDAEARIWYQWYFNTERGRAGLTLNRRSLCKLLWKQWSPTWNFTDETYDRTAPSFDNPEFVDLVIHSYRHRLGNAPGDPRFEAIEHQLAQRPRITVPTITLYGADDGVGRAPVGMPPGERVTFPSMIARRVIAGSGHFMPREKPDAVSAAILEVLAAAR